jgi:2-oxo-4-hydroxy-4-carboxy-5-ureidoimidazoline decarboxylase
MPEYTVTQLSQADNKEFVEALGEVYENSPWVANRAWEERPFTSVNDIHSALKTVVENAPREKKLQLLRAHPDLGENTEMTDESKKEQASAGLDQLSPELYERFQELNGKYQAKFNFPFIMSVKDESPQIIKEEMEKRLENSQNKEFDTALDEVHEIARLRLIELVSDSE